MKRREPPSELRDTRHLQPGLRRSEASANSSAANPNADLCVLCGGGPDCSCLELGTRLTDAAAALRRAGMEAARSGRLCEARRLLRSSIAIDSADARTWAVLGLCEFSIGDMTAARTSWDIAADLHAESPAASWVREIESGAVRGALEGYNDALEEANRGQWAQARERLQDVRATLPDFVPLAILLGLVHEGEGDRSAARDVWLEAVALARDHPDLLRLLSRSAEPSALAVSGVRSSWAYGGVAVAALGIAGLLALPLLDRREGPSQPPALQETATLEPLTPPVDPPEGEESGTSGIAAVSGERFLSGAVRDTAVMALQYDVAWRLFQEARTQSEAGNWAAVVPRATLVDDLAPGRFYHDDALYLLARAYAHTGRSDEAQAVAGTLLSTYPTSIYVNSVTRSIAETGRHP